jgi:hypothetical protein
MFIFCVWMLGTRFTFCLGSICAVVEKLLKKMCRSFGVAGGFDGGSRGVLYGDPGVCQPPLSCQKDVKQLGECVAVVVVCVRAVYVTFFVAFVG